MSKGFGRACLALALVMMLAVSGFAVADGAGQPDALVKVAVTTVDFSNGNTGFLRLDRARRGTSGDFSLELDDFDGQPAVKIAAQGAKTPFIGISASGLLSPEDLPNVSTVVIKLGLKSTDDKFWPMTGTVYAYTGEDPTALTESTSKFGVQTPESNPKDIYVKVASPFAAGANNYLVIQPTQDDGSSYTGKNDLYILGLKFLDADGNALPVNPEAGEDFPEGYDAPAEDNTPTEEYALGAAPFESGWINYNSTDIPLDVWNRAVALVVEYAPNEDGSSPIDTNVDAGKFVVQVLGGPAEQGWREIPNNDPLVERVEGQSLTLTLDDMDQVAEVQNLGYGAWDGADTITRIYLRVKTEAKLYELGEVPFEAGWINYNSSGVPLEIWQSAAALLVEFTPSEDGSSPIETNPGGSKFVVQVVGGPAEQGWREITLDDPLVELEPGKSLKLYLDDMDQVTEVQNLGFGCWDGVDTITGISLILK
ncbi:MAG: hypothetical protein LBK46_10615 [Oscillospiraceae bacterium]|nr:hypothetical protein [Oscillospiraceae bacterium]